MVQDFLLPTIAYYGGSAEIAYFAQTSEVYRILERPPTTILPRASLTFVEKHTGRAMERYGLTFGDLFQGPDHVLARVVEEHLGKETTEAFAHTNETVNQQLDALREELRRTDATLAEALEKDAARSTTSSTGCARASIDRKWPAMKRFSASWLTRLICFIRTRRSRKDISM